MMKDNEKEMFPLVLENGNIIGSISRNEAHDGTKRLHPVVHLHVFNNRGELYLQKRPAWKDIQPNKWDTACGGHIDLGENVEEALKREVKEELGITDYIPERIGQYILRAIVRKNLSMYIKQHTMNKSFPMHKNLMEDAFGRRLKLKITLEKTYSHPILKANINVSSIKKNKLILIKKRDYNLKCNLF